jgi:hypothetical protein
MALSPYESHKCQTDKQRQAKQDDVDRHRVIFENLVCSGVESRLREVENTGETNDKAVDFPEGSEAEDFGGIVAGSDVNKRYE